MSEQVLNIECSCCHHEEKVIVPHLINRENDVDSYQKIMNQTLFLYTCQNCQNQLVILHPTILHDAIYHGMCFYCPDDDSYQDAYNNIQVLKNTEDGQKLNQYQIRIVENEKSFYEKALIWNLGLDDKTVEMWKLTYLYHIVSHNADFEADSSYLRKEDDMFKIDYYQGDNYLGSVEADEKMLEDVKRRFLSIPLASEQHDEYHVDMAWAMQHLTDLLHRPD